MNTERRIVYCNTHSPVGELLLIGEVNPTRDAFALTGIYFANAPHARGAVPPGARKSEASFTHVIEQLRSYFGGTRTSFDIAMKPNGTAFQRDVWKVLTSIPFGETRTYGEIARALGRPQASRAVGAANGKNPLSIVVPCHRVIGGNGTLTGYAGGVEQKRLLLAHEGALDEAVRRLSRWRIH